MAGYIVMFSEEHEMSLALVGTFYSVGPERFDEFRKLIEHRIGMKIPPNNQAIKLDDPKWESLIEWLKKNASRQVALESLAKEQYVYEQDTSQLIDGYKNKQIAEITIPGNFNRNEGTK